MEEKIVFYGEPNIAVSIRAKHPYTQRPYFKRLFVFDNQGVHEFKGDAKTAEYLKTIYRYEDGNALIDDDDNAQLGDKIMFRCKKCNYATYNRGEFLKHHRQKHPKKEEF